MGIIMGNKTLDLDTITDEQYFEGLNEMFSSFGWQILVAELMSNAVDLNDVQTVKSPEELKFRQGQLATIGLLLNYKQTMELAQADDDDEEVTLQ